MPKGDRQPRCRCRLGPGHFEVRARVERFVEPAVLLLLAEGPSHGYELADALEKVLQEGKVDFGNLYRLLRSLEADGLVASAWNEDAPGPLKRTYELTIEGKALLGTWAGSLRVSQEKVAAFLRRYDDLTKGLHEENGTAHVGYEGREAT